VCDEPFAGVDPAGATRLGDLLRKLADKGVAVVFADHHVAEALRICHRALLLLDGRVAVSADPDAFREDPLVRGRYLGTWHRTSAPPTASSR
jgi:ABC-type lipopolysaccharide export system ATPase subunit